jgi:hypothetical protein
LAATRPGSDHRLEIALVELGHGLGELDALLHGALGAAVEVTDEGSGGVGGGVRGLSGVECGSHGLESFGENGLDAIGSLGDGGVRAFGQGFGCCQRGSWGKHDFGRGRGLGNGRGRRDGQASATGRASATETGSISALWTGSAATLSTGLDRDVRRLDRQFGERDGRDQRIDRGRIGRAGNRRHFRIMTERGRSLGFRIGEDRGGDLLGAAFGGRAGRGGHRAFPSGRMERR